VRPEILLLLYMQLKSLKTGAPQGSFMIRLERCRTGTDCCCLPSSRQYYYHLESNQSEPVEQDCNWRAVDILISPQPRQLIMVDGLLYVVLRPVEFRVQLDLGSTRLELACSPLLLGGLLGNAELLACVLQLQDMNNYSATTLTVTVHSTRL
jgi:hypothetical protein